MAKLKYIKSLLLLLAIFSFGNSKAQIVDEVIAVIGEKIVSRSELDFEISQAEAQFGVLSNADKCEMLENLMVKKLMLNQAEIDSVVVMPDEIEAELDKRIRYFSGQVGGDDKLAKYLGKSILEYKNEIRPKIRDQRLVKALEDEKFAEIKVSHREVKQYFDSIPKDSLPRIDAEYAIGLLVIEPKFSEEAKEYAQYKAMELRKRLMKGEKFELLAGVYSGDPGSAKEGGMLPEFGRGEMMPSFELESYKLKKDSISPVFESPYGYHIIKLERRLGDKITARHILIKPLITNDEQAETIFLLDSLKTELEQNNLTFCEAVGKFSNVEQYQYNCGLMADPFSGLLKLSMAGLQPDMAKIITNLKIGQFSAPQPFMMENGTVAARVIYLKSETPAHIANMQDDYPRIQIAAQEAKKNEEIEKWVVKTKKTAYTNINSDYLGCNFTKWNYTSN